MTVVQGFMGETTAVLALGIGVAALLAVAWAALSIVDSARRSKPTMNWKRGMALGMFANQRTPNHGMTPWIVVGLLGVVGAALLMFVIYLLREAIHVF